VQAYGKVRALGLMALGLNLWGCGGHASTGVFGHSDLAALCCSHA
jgi:hypothetical protein